MKNVTRWHHTNIIYIQKTIHVFAFLGTVIYSRKEDHTGTVQLECFFKIPLEAGGERIRVGRIKF